MTNYQAVATQAARQYLPPALADDFIRQLNAESHFVPGARSPAGARWIGQFMPATARAYGVHDDVSSIIGAARYDADLLKRYGTFARALSAYNSGNPDAYKDPNFAHGQTYNYVRQILGGQVPAPAAGNPAAAAAPNPSPPGAAAAPPPGLNLAAVFNAGNRAVGLPTINANVFTTASTPTGQTVRFARDHGATPSPHETHVVTLAKEFLGTPYSWGGGGPAGPSRGTGRGANTVGFDCSSFVQFLAAKQGVQIPRTTFEQFKTGTPIPRGRLQPGDVVFFYPTKAGPDHEGIYIGHGQFIHAPHTGDVVKVSRLAQYSGIYAGARRLI